MYTPNEQNTDALANRILEHLLEDADTLHNAASEASLESLTGMPLKEAIEWLEDIIYTLEETVTESKLSQRIGSGYELKATKRSGNIIYLERHQ
ncbi:hypothetical protein MASR2M15_25350 [Anaerolineales bacterium]